jgi:hypothetical protein
MKKYILNDYKRFYGIEEEEGEKLFEENINKMISFFKNRPKTILKYFNKDL